MPRRDIPDAIRIMIALSLMSGVLIAVLKGLSLLLQWLGWEIGADLLIGNE
jgi:hypothetical protein